MIFQGTNYTAIKKFFLGVLLFSLTFPCFAQEVQFIDASEQINWHKTSPLDFLKFLKENKDFAVFMGYTNLPAQDWISEEDVDMLIHYINSSDEAAPVSSEKAERLVKSGSTVGREAMFLIAGFISKRYPPELCSVYDFYPEPENFKKWWEAYKKPKEKNIESGGFRTYRIAPTTKEVTKDSKPWNLSLADSVIYRKVTIKRGYSKIFVLGIRVSNNVSYVWANGYKRYVLSKYVFPNINEVYKK